MTRKGTLPSKELVAELRDHEGLTFVTIASRYNVSKQAVHKAYKKFCIEHGVEWKTRNRTN